MKKMLSLSVILFCCNFIFAQQIPKNKIENKKVFCGLSLGPTVDWFVPTVEDISRENVKGGFFAGVNLDINIKGGFLYFSTGAAVRYLQTGLSFCNQYDFSMITAKDTAWILPTVRTYQTTYLTIPTGIKFRTKPIAGCVFVGKAGLYHNFKLGGEQFDNFELPGADPKYFVSTKRVKNTDAALFAESGYLGLGFEYHFKQGIRVFANADYSCQFNYFSSKAKSNVSEVQFRSLVHSLHIVFGVLF